MLSFSVFAEDKATIEMLKEYFPQEFEVKSTKEIYFWSAGVADIYDASKNEDDLPSYIYIDLYNKESASLLERLGQVPKFKERAKEYPAILSAMSKYCTSTKVTAECVLEGMVKKLGINNCYVRADEGYECKVCNGQTKCKKL